MITLAAALAPIICAPIAICLVAVECLLDMFNRRKK